MSEFKQRAEAYSEPADEQPTDRFLGDRDLRDSFNEALELWDERLPEGNIEEFYIAAELLTRLGHLPEEGPGLKDVRYLIEKTLAFSLYEPDREPHKKLVKAIARCYRHDPDRRDEKAIAGGATLVSLNWDLLVDQALEATGIPYHYGAERVREYQSGELDTLKPADVPLLKLHGSLNWWHCGECDLLSYQPRLKTTLDEREETPWPCGECEASMEPLFVPPTSEKLGPRPLSPLSDIWAKARRSLRTCRTAVFAGYSFPPTDTQFKVLVQEALSQNETLERIVVVTKPKHGTKKARFEDRYTEIFAGTSLGPKLEFEYETFEDWLLHQNLERQLSTWRDEPRRT